MLKCYMCNFKSISMLDDIEIIVCFSFAAALLKFTNTKIIYKIVVIR